MTQRANNLERSECIGTVWPESRILARAMQPDNSQLCRLENAVSGLRNDAAVIDLS